jgi:hypothetical protein
MAIGPGRYDDLCTIVREQAQAAGAIVIVIDGKAGDGFACQASPATTATLPRMLESMAAQIRVDLMCNTQLCNAWWSQLTPADQEFWKARARSTQIEDAWTTFIRLGGGAAS